MPISLPMAQAVVGQGNCLHPTARRDIERYIERKIEIRGEIDKLIAAAKEVVRLDDQWKEMIAAKKKSGFF